MYLLDTNVISEVRKIKTGKANPNFVKWFSTIAEQDIFINVTVLMEIERGILAKERKDIQQGVILRTWFNHVVLPTFHGKILKIDEKTAQICAKLHIPDHAPENDAWIASSAIQYQLILVTRNTADFARLGVKLFNPFEEDK